jgi:ribokinase
VNLDGVSAAKGATAVSVILVPPEGKKSILLAGNANNTWDNAALEAVAARIAAAPSRSVLTIDTRCRPSLCTMP